MPFQVTRPAEAALTFVTDMHKRVAACILVATVTVVAVEASG